MFMNQKHSTSGFRTVLHGVRLKDKLWQNVKKMSSQQKKYKYDSRSEMIRKTVR